MDHGQVCGTPEHDAGEGDHVQADHGCGQAFIVACEPAAASRPGKGTLDHPTSWQQHKAPLGVGQLNHFQPDSVLVGGGFGLLKGLIGATLLFIAGNLLTDTMSGGRADRPEWFRASRTYPLLNASANALVDFVERRRDAPPISDAEANR